MARTRSTLTMGTAALALLALSASIGAQPQPPQDQGPRQGSPQGDRPGALAGQGPRDAPRDTPHEAGRQNPPGDRPNAQPRLQEQGRQPQRDQQQRPQVHSEASPSRPDAPERDAQRDQPRDPGRGQRPDGDRPREGGAGTPDQPRQQEAERRREQEQHWQQQRQDGSQGLRPIRADVREVAHKDTQGREFQVPTNDRVNVVTTPGRFDWAGQSSRRSFDGCPPGIAKRYANCAPPTLSEPAPNRWNQPGWYGDYNRESGYRYTDGYLLRLGADSAVTSYVPLLGGALAVGQPWPGTYGAMALPDYYSRYYDLGPASSYRYYDNVIYRLDPDDAAITAVAALLTGNSIEVGRPMPAGYDVYNVPYRYRDQYYDGRDALYRYSDGTIYQLDPATRIVRAAIELLA
ncbi:hypothetical protein WBP07_00445 [Novosphingobium sp. BL-8A]|uniref:hypothetical protein n=1 Tax=Novosphingobium sp. BL-8A TaxID=3127639 RepID=UPI0037572DF3